ncbi:MAG: RNA polymerase-binding protein DksA [Pseudomonadota bacterium]|nr:RNA polymerase-binding protein DksA [Pseudomonadota bacterium]
MSVVSGKTVLGFGVYESQSDEDYMSSQQQKHFHDVLLSWYSALSSQTVDFKETLQGGETFIDELDKASQEENQRMTLRASDRRRKLQKKVAEAIARLQQGEYGYCKTCGEAIGLSRLAVRPTAEQCINCKTVSELYEKRGQE